jgi:hypothetical protein
MKYSFENDNLILDLAKKKKKKERKRRRRKENKILFNKRKG